MFKKLCHLTYLRSKICNCCGVRLDTINKTAIKHANNDDIVKKLNDAKTSILLKKT